MRSNSVSLISPLDHFGDSTGWGQIEQAAPQALVV